MQQKINYLITGFIVLLLVILGIFYYQKNKKATLVPNNVPNSPLEESPKGEVDNNTSTPAQTPPLKRGTTAEINVKFNTAMANARTAFINKDYPQAIVYYNQALSYNKVDTVYAGLFTAYGAQGDWVKAQSAIDSAIKLKPTFTDYWVSKLTVLDEKTPASYQDLKNVYNEGLLKVNPETKIDLITYFATAAEKNGQISDAISLWTYAKTLYPQNSSIYQAEIDRLQKN